MIVFATIICKCMIFVMDMFCERRRALPIGEPVTGANISIAVTIVSTSEQYWRRRNTASCTGRAHGEII